MGQRPALSWVLVVALIAFVLLLGYLAFRLGRNLTAQIALTTPLPTASSPATLLPLVRPSPTYTPTGTPTPRPSATATATPTPSPTPTAVITALPPIPQGFLVTVSQPVQIVKTYDSAPAWWPRFPPFNLIAGSFTLVAFSQVSAGVDFAQVGSGDVVRRGSAVTVTLPAPQLYGHPTIDPTQSYIVEHPGVSPKDLSRVIAAQADLQGMIENWAIEHGILMTARDTGQEMLELWFRRLGFSQVNINWDYTRSPH